MDPVDALNRIFPDAESFSTGYEAAKDYAEKCRASLAYKLSNRPDVRAQKAEAVQAPEALNALILDTHEIQRLGTETLDRVKNVTHEIERLDHTKENLTATMRILRQLKMLTNLYLQLDSLLKDRRYEDMAGSVKAASDLIEYFRPFRPLPQISRLSQEIGEMESKIYAQVQADFGAALHAENSHAPNGTGNGLALTPSASPPPPSLSAASSSSPPLPSDALRAACTVLDSLDSAHGNHTSRQRLLGWYYDTMLSEYFRIFAPGDEAGSLENVNRRYTYLKNKVILKYMGFHTHFFPSDWAVKPGLVQHAGERTANDLVSQLSQLRSTDSDQIQLLLSTIQESLDFEKFAKSSPVISNRLMPYLSLWVDFQDRQLKRRVSTYARMLTPPDENDDVIPSSKELVNFYRALLTQLSKLKHQEATVSELAEVMASHLGHYSRLVLAAYLPRHLRGQNDIVVAGKVDATTEYVNSTTHQLVKNISSQLSESESIDAIFEKLALSELRKVGVKVEDAMVSYIKSVLEPLWVELAAQYSAHHGRVLDVSRVSPFTTTVITRLKDTLSNVFRASATPRLVYGTATRTIDVVCVGFLTVAMARVVKPLSESQVEQMLLDLGAIKSQVMSQIAELVPEDVKQKDATKRLERLQSRVLDGFAHAEAVLKVLMTPSDPTETFVRNYHLLIKDRSTLNFRKVLDVKGVRFQPRAMDKFKVMSSQDPHLIAESPLLSQIGTVPPSSMTSPSAYENRSSNGFNASGASAANGFGFKRFGDFLRREHQ